MKKLTVFYLTHCPYCRKAKEALRELKEQVPGYADVEIEWIEESEHPEIADRYDYYRVPSVFCEGKKLYECSPAHGYDEIRQRFGDALRTAMEG